MPVFALMGLFWSCQPGAISIHVAVNGSDQNDGTLKHPFATIAKARDFIRQSTIINQQSTIKVLIHEGIYYLDEPIKFGPADSGWEGQDIWYTNYKNEKVTISGSLKVEADWTEWKDGIYQCKVPGLEGKILSELFVNGHRQVRARYPNGSSLQPEDDAFIYPIKADEWPHHKIFYDPETFAKKDWQKPDQAVLHIFPSHHWGNLQYRIKDVDRNENFIMIEQRDPQINETYFSTMSHPGTWISTNSNFFIDNVFEEIDVAGEWHFDDELSVLFYKPFDSIDLHTAVIEIPLLKELVIMKGTMQSPVKNIRFENLRFTGTSPTYLDRYEYPSMGDWGIVRSGAVFIEGVDNCRIGNCFFDAVGGNAIFLNQYAHDVELTGNIITNSGESAICLVGKSHLDFSGTYTCPLCGAIHPWGWGEPSEEIPSNCTITNNLIHDIGYYGKQVAGVFLALSKENTISHNQIFNTPRAAICLNDGWFGGHLVEFNDIYSTVRETGDHGPFNSWGREPCWCERQSHGQGASHEAGEVKAFASETTTIRNNRFRDDHGWGIDLDDGSSNYHVINNLCIGVSVKLREGAYRTVENNIFYKGANPPSHHIGYEHNHDIFRNNIVVISTTGRAFHFIGPPEQGPWMERIDSNLYYCTSGNFIARVDLAGRSFSFGSHGMDWEEWQKMGFDRHSIVEDPLFRDPEKGDFALPSQSPAFTIGFKPFPLDQFGLSPEFNNLWK